MLSPVGRSAAIAMSSDKATSGVVEARAIASERNVFFFKQKTAYEIGTGDWSSDVCSSDLPRLIDQQYVYLCYR